MPGQQLAATWTGNRAELLALYALSAISSVTHVRREEDFGADLLCSLTTLEDKVLRAGRAFAVQVKSSSHPLTYGGVDSSGNWKAHEISWLFGQDQPLILAVADTKDWSVSLYSTVRIWYIRWQIGLSPSQLLLHPDMPLPEHKVSAKSQPRYPDRPWAGSPIPEPSNGFVYDVPLGPPIVRISVKDPPQDHQSIRETLRLWLDADYENIQYHHAGIPKVVEWAKWSPNHLPQMRLVYHFWNTQPGWNIDALSKTVAPAIQSFLLHIEAQHLTELEPYFLPLASWLHANGLFDEIGAGALAHLRDRPGAKPL